MLLKNTFKIILVECLDYLFETVRKCPVPYKIGFFTL